MIDTRTPPIPPAAALIVAVLALSWGGPLVRLATAPALVVSAWRFTISVLFIAVVLLIRRAPLPALSRRDWLFAAASGIFLAGHFWSWIASLSYTTVSSSVVLVSVTPVFVALLSATMPGEAATRRQWLGIAISVMGAAIIAWGDFAVGGDAIIGDVLALAGAVFVSLYYVIGRRLRSRLYLWWYIGIVYGIAALVLVAAVVVSRNTALFGYPRGDWLVFLGLAAGPMILGHTGVNYALRYVRAYVANLVALAEPIGATLIA